MKRNQPRALGPIRNQHPPPSAQIQAPLFGLGEEGASWEALPAQAPQGMGPAPPMAKCRAGTSDTNATVSGSVDSLSCSVAPFFLSFLGCRPTKNGLPQKGLPFFPRVTEQLSSYSRWMPPFLQAWGSPLETNHQARLGCEICDSSCPASGFSCCGIPQITHLAMGQNPKPGCPNH